MNYLGFFCVGVGILSMAMGLLCLAISLLSKETAIRNRARFFSMGILPIALLLLGVGIHIVNTELPLR